LKVTNSYLICALILKLPSGTFMLALPHLGQEPKHFAIGYQGRTLLVTKQMIDIWDEISADSDHSIKRVLSGPMGMGKSYISYFLASKAYAEEWPVLYIADASMILM